MKLSFRSSIYLSLSFLLIIPILITFFIFEKYHIKTVRNEFHAQARITGKGIVNEIDEYSRNLLKLAEKYSKNKIIISGLSSNNRLMLVDKLTELYKYSNLDLLEAGNNKGIVFARGHNPKSFGEDKSSQFIIKKALNGKPVFDIEYGASGIALRAVHPVLNKNTGICGTIMTGFHLDNNFIEKFKIITGFEMALFENDKIITKTIKSDISWTPENLINNNVFSADFFIDNKEQWGAYIPIYHQSGSLFGGLLIWKDKNLVLKPMYINRFTTIFSFVVGLILSLIIAIFLSHSFTSPLKKILSVMRKISDGMIETPMPESNWIEFQELSNNFKNMLDELKKSNDKIKKAQRQLIIAGKLAVLGQVTAELAHEIRNPLNSIEINLRIIKDKLNENEINPVKLKNKVEIIQTEIRRLDQTIKDFVEAGGKIILNKIPSNIKDIIERVITITKPQLDSLGIGIVCNFDDDPVIDMDTNRFHQMLLNIFLNACQSMKPGGRITVSLTKFENKTLLSITDTGKGMKKEDIEKVYDISFSTRKSGLGVGLSYILRVIQAHNWEFNIESAPNEGTTIKILI